MKNKFTNEVLADTDDARSGKLSDIQQQLDELQQNGMTPMDIRAVLFNKMLDIYQVPNDHFLRDAETPERIDDPSIALQLQQARFFKKTSISITLTTRHYSSSIYSEGLPPSLNRLFLARHSLFSLLFLPYHLTLKFL